MFFSAVYNLVSLLASVAQSVDLPAPPAAMIQVTTEQLHPRCQDYFIAEVVAIDKYVWE